jgi:hypothetical protein
MSIITLPNTFVPRTLADATQVNADFSTIVNDYNGNITDANISATAAIELSKLSGFGFAGGARITCVSGTPVTTADQTGASTIYVTPYQTGYVPIWNGTIWTPYLLTEQSLALTGLTASTMYDVYLYLNAGSLAMYPLQAWSGNTPPARTILDGIWVLTANFGATLIGSIQASGTTTTNDSAASRWVCNYLAPVPRQCFCTDTTGSWTETSTSWTPSHASTTDGVGRFSFVQAVAQSSFSIQFSASVANNTAGATTFSGIGINSISNPSSFVTLQAYTNGANGVLGSGVAAAPEMGYTYVQRLEQVSAHTGTYIGGTSIAYASAVIQA